MISLHSMVAAFAHRWGPKGEAYFDFLADLRNLLEAYGMAALVHESLPDTEHEHGDPV